MFSMAIVDTMICSPVDRMIRSPMDKMIRSLVGQDDSLSCGTG